ncbi:MAG: phage major tail tube protein [Cetobacterium sp.]
MRIPEKVINFTCYVNGSTELAGMVDLTLPTIEYMSETISGAGISGEIDSITPGHTSAMNFSVNFRSLVDKNLSLTKPESYAFEVKGALQETDSKTQATTVKKLTVAVRGFPKKTELGKLGVAKPTDSNQEFTCEYLKVNIDGKTAIEIDKHNMVFMVDGKDYLAETRAALGK